MQNVDNQELIKSSAVSCRLVAHKSVLITASSLYEHKITNNNVINISTKPIMGHTVLTRHCQHLINQT